MAAINRANRHYRWQSGVTLIELIVFIVVVGIALVALIGVFNQAARANADPLIRMRALEATQSKLDEIIALKYDQGTPTGGIPACGTAGGQSCDNSPDPDMNDVDDFHNWSDSFDGYQRSVTVTAADNLKTITVSVRTPMGEVIRLSAQRANF
ncbi:type IV pilus modification PilV family protein [Cellvibrio japonicus]|nr:MSHA biogenesis protein MshD [Cellvibrio japonicus]QEI12792.1 MSHA biogenesis protein MshD [Cellvibrio japonicus]QEI16366.1 MSHA biogenesis protein MshD [Cellvibrio japonicus]QEI19944.1 MSHA biogenesis protein MshD [Cellvibrio japonicus]